MSTPNPFDQFDASPSLQTAGANPFDQFDNTAGAPQAPKAGAQPAQQPTRESFPGQGIMETADQLGTGLIAQPIAGLAGLADIPLHAAGIVKTTPADVVRNTQNALTYRPYTSQGQALSNTIGYLPNKVSNAAQFVGGQLNSALAPVIGNTGAAALGTALSTGIQMLPAVLGLRGRGINVDTSAIPTVAKLTNSAAEARSLGFKLLPSGAGASLPTRFIEGLANSPRLRSSLSIQNGRLADKLVAQDLAPMGLKEGTPITQNVIDTLKAPSNAVYDQMSSLGAGPTDDIFRRDLANLGNTPGTSFPLAKNADIQSLKDAYNVPSFDAGDAIQQIKQLRKLGHANIKTGAAYMAPNAPLLGDLGQAQLKVATALEDQLDRNLSQGIYKGAPQDLTISKFRNARQNLAKLHSVENAMIGDTGNVSSKALAVMQKHNVPLSGNMAKVATVATDFPDVMQDVERIKNFQPVGALRGMMGGGEVLGGIVSGHPGLGLATAGTTLIAPPIIRNLLGRSFIQNRLPDVLSGTVSGAAPAALTSQTLGLLGSGAAPGLFAQYQNPQR